MHQAMHQATQKLRSAANSAAKAAALAALLAATAHLGLSATPATAATAIEEVVVTAQRTEESLQDVPISVTALTGEMLEDRGLINPSDLQLSAPNVSFTATNFGNSSFSIRGIGRLVISSSGDSGVSTHINEIPLTTNLNAVEYFDVERVEILRGPQGTLYGRNATGGAINMVTKMPNYETIDGFVDAEWGDYNHTRTKGALNLPLGTNMGFRAAFMSLERDGYTKNLAADSVSTLDNSTLPAIDDDIDGRDLYSYRGTLAWDFSDNGNLWVQYNYFEEDDDRARLTNQVCKRSANPALGCDPNEEGFDSPHLGATTGGLGFMTNGQGTTMANSNLVSSRTVGLTNEGTLPLGAAGPGHRAAGSNTDYLLYDHVAPELGLREVFTDFEPVFYYEEEVWSWGMDYEFENVTLDILGAYQETKYVQQMDYNLNVGPVVQPAPNSVRDLVHPVTGQKLGYRQGQWPTSAPSGGAGGDVTGAGGCNYADGSAGVFGGCVNPDDGTRVFSMDQASGNTEYWTMEVRVASELDGPINFQVGYSVYDGTRPGNDYYVNANSLDSLGLFGTNLANGLSLYPTMFNVPSTVDDPSYNEGEALFGEVYWDITDKLKFTAGLRYNRDEKFIHDSSAFLSSFDQNTIMRLTAQGTLAAATQACAAVTQGGGTCATSTNPLAQLSAAATGAGITLATSANGIAAFLAGAGVYDPMYLENLELLPGYGDAPDGRRWGRGRSTAAGGSLSLLTGTGGMYTQADRELLALHGMSDAQIDALQTTLQFSKERVEAVRMLGTVTSPNETRHLRGIDPTEEWTALTGRIGVDWQLTDDILVFGFLTRGYKPGGFNPPVAPEFQDDPGATLTFNEEEVDGAELGAKTSLLGGDLIVNGSVFFYDYKGLQITRIKFNSSINENVDAEILGAEAEVVWQPSFIQNFVVDASLSWLDTSLQDVESVDPVGKTAGDSRWVNLKNIDFGASIAENYVARGDFITDAVITALETPSATGAVGAMSHRNDRAVDGTTYAATEFAPADGSTRAKGIPAYISRQGLEMALGANPACQPDISACVNSGLLTDVSGNQLPNSPEFTLRLGVQYTLPLEAILGALTFRWDYYWQEESYAREFNTVGDQIDAWDQHNLSVIYESANGDWQVRAWVRNAEDEENVTGKYLTSDTSGYFRNYFLTEPRIYGLTARYQFTKE